MGDIQEVLGRNLRTYRSEKKLSLDRLADLTGVSKAMLGQIERGESSPTITTVLKIANGLKVSFTSLIQAPQPDTLFISKDQVTAFIEDEGRRVYPLFTFDPERRFEVYYVEIDVGCHVQPAAGLPGTYQFITVFDGELTIDVNGNKTILRNGEAIRFRSDLTHDYQNSGHSLVRANCVLYYS